MAEHQAIDPGLFAIEVDADDYAETAAEDNPAVPRTYQSEADFRAIKSVYSAKIDGEPGQSTYDDLIAAVPVLSGSPSDETQHVDPDRVKLSKKDVQLLGYAVGEMYFDRRYADAIRLCERVKQRCDVDGKLDHSLVRWMDRCRERMV